MAVKVLLQVKGDASGATAAVEEAETALGGLGTGVDWSGLGSKLAKSAGPAIKSGLIGAALAVGDWLAEGLSSKLATPEGAEAQGAIDELTGELDKIRDKILQPIIDLIPRVVELLLPLLGHVDNLVTLALPPLTALLTLAIGALELIATAITNTLDGISNVVDAVTGAIGTLQSFLQDVQTAVQGAIDGVVGFFQDIKDGIDKLLQPIKDAVKPITDLLDSIFGKAESAPTPDGGQRTTGGFSAPPPGLMAMGRGGTTINVYTGADPRAVVRALRRYTGDNGDPGGLVRAFRGT
jgi:hypothetical protein